MIKFVTFNEARFLAAMLFTLASSIYGRKSCRRNAIFAIFVLYVAYGARNMVYLSLSLLLNIALVNLIKMDEYIITLINILNIYLYKYIGHYLEPGISGTFDITGFLMILTIKMGYLVRDYDHNISNCLDYILFVPGLLTGPTISYKIFLETPEAKKFSFPIRNFVFTLALGMLYAILKCFDFKHYILDNSTAFPKKLLSLYLYNLSGRSKFHFSWTFAHCCFILRGFPGYLNIDFKSVEFCESVREIATNWNKFVSSWTREFFFLPLKGRSTRLAVLVSYLATATLHGFNLCYFIFSLSFCIYSQPITRANELIKFRTLRIIQMFGFVSYFSMPFYLLDYKELYHVWKNLYFFGHIYCTFWLIFFKIRKNAPKSDKKSAGREVNDAAKLDSTKPFSHQNSPVKFVGEKAGAMPYVKAKA